VLGLPTRARRRSIASLNDHASAGNSFGRASTESASVADNRFSGIEQLAEAPPTDGR
jgi:hypothetical protein